MNKIDNRKDILLLLLYAPGESGYKCEPIRGRTRMMKLLFLLAKETNILSHFDIEDYYDFVAYDYGPFSKDVFDDIDFLRNVGLISSVSGGRQNEIEQIEDQKFVDDLLVDSEREVDNVFEEEEYILTPPGREFVEEQLLPNLIDPVNESFATLKTREGSLSLSSLLRYVYINYPESATRSKLKYLSA